MHDFRPRQARALAQQFARCPDHAAAGAGDHLAGGVIAVADGHAAIGVVVLGREAHRIFLGGRQPLAGLRVLPVAQQRRLLALGKDLVGIIAPPRAALGQIDIALAIKSDVRDRIVVGCAGHVNLKARIGAETAVLGNRDRPDLRAFGGGVVEAVAIDANAPNHSALGRIMPGCGVLGVERGVGDVEPVRRVVGHRGEALAGAALDAVVVVAKVRAVHVKAVDHAGRQIGNEDLPRLWVESEVAKRRAAVGRAVELDVGKQRNVAGRSVHLPDAAGRAALGGAAPLARHPLRAGIARAQPRDLARGVLLDDLQAEGRGGRKINVGRTRQSAVRPAPVIQRDAEDLADIAGLGLEHGRSGKQLALRRLAARRNVLNAHRCAVEVDEQAIERIAARRGSGGRRRTRKPGDDGVAFVQHALLRLGGHHRRAKHRRPKSQAQKPPPEVACKAEWALLGLERIGRHGSTFRQDSSGGIFGW